MSHILLTHLLHLTACAVPPVLAMSGGTSGSTMPEPALRNPQVIASFGGFCIEPFASGVAGGNDNYSLQGSLSAHEQFSGPNYLLALEPIEVLLRPAPASIVIPPPPQAAAGALGNRYLCLELPEPSGEEVIRVRVVALDGFPTLLDTLYVGTPFDAPEEDASRPGLTFTAARLQCEATPHDWTPDIAVSIFGGEIIPGSTYEVQRASTTCPNLLDEACWSKPLQITTAKYGDVAPLYDAPGNPLQPDFNDIAAIVSKFLAAPSAPVKAVCQLQPNCVYPDRAIDFKDIAADVNAFLGVAYADVNGGPCTCPSAVTCGGSPCTGDFVCGGGLCVGGFCTDACGRCAP